MSLLPMALLQGAYDTIIDGNQVMYGSSTACVAVLDRARSVLHTATLGDSGFLVLRGNQIVAGAEFFTTLSYVGTLELCD